MNPEHQVSKLQEEIKRLKMENVQLRRQMLSPGRETSDVVDTDCQQCFLHRFQNKRLNGELSGSQSPPRNCSVSMDSELQAISGMLSKERERRVRLESIVCRQQAYIGQMSGHSTLPIPFTREANLPRFLATDEFLGYRHMDSELDCAESQPWDMDIDDLNRQLTELSENVHRVKLASKKLNSSSSPHPTAMKPSHGQFST